MREFDDSTTDDGLSDDDTTVGDTDAADAEFEGRAENDLDAMDDVDEGALASEARFDDARLTLPPEEDLPDTQGEDPLIAELGEDGDGDLAPEDL